jgi:hypothetical protein
VFRTSVTNLPCHFQSLTQSIFSLTAYHSQLIKQYGGQLSFPGIQVYDQFIPLEVNDLERVRGHGDYWLDELLVMAQEEDASCGSSGSERNQQKQRTNLNNNTLPSSSNGMHNRPTQTSPPAVTDNIITPTNSPPRRSMPQRALSLGSVTTGISELSSGTTTMSLFCDIILPNGQSMKPAEVTRKLLARVEHKVIRANGKEWYYFRGQHALDVVKELFFQNMTGVNEQEVAAFANQLGKCNGLCRCAFGSELLVLTYCCCLLFLSFS